MYQVLYRGFFRWYLVPSSTNPGASTREINVQCRSGLMGVELLEQAVATKDDCYFFPVCVDICNTLCHCSLFSFLYCSCALFVFKLSFVVYARMTRNDKEPSIEQTSTVYQRKKGNKNPGFLSSTIRPRAAASQRQITNVPKIVW